MTGMNFLYLILGIIAIISLIILAIIKRINPHVMKNIQLMLPVLVMVLFACQAMRPWNENLIPWLMLLLYLNALAMASVIIYERPKPLKALSIALIIIFIIILIFFELSIIVFTGIHISVN